MALPDLLLYCDICINKNMSCGFIELFNSRNSFFRLIAQASIVVEVNNHDLSGLSQCDSCLQQTYRFYQYVWLVRFLKSLVSIFPSCKVQLTIHKFDRFFRKIISNGLSLSTAHSIEKDMIYNYKHIFENI